MNSMKIGTAATAPVSPWPSERLSSKPTKVPTTICGVKPMNQALRKSLVVPVLPPTGQFSSRAWIGGAVLDHALQHGGDLVGGDRVDHLLAGRSEVGAVVAGEVVIAVAARAPSARKMVLPSRSSTSSIRCGLIFRPPLRKAE